MPTYSIRSVIRWPRIENQQKPFVYEERITLWNAATFEEAIDLAETDAKAYAQSKGFECLDLFQSYWLFNSLEGLPQGREVYSLIRESDLDPSSYLDAFFDTGLERSGDYGDQMK